jgi:hypothetical protein
MRVDARDELAACLLFNSFPILMVPACVCARLTLPTAVDAQARTAGEEVGENCLPCRCC